MTHFKNLFVALAFLSLTACAQVADQEEVTTAPFKVVEKKEEPVVQEETVTYEYQQDVEGIKQTVREVLTYKGEEFLKLDLELRQPLDVSTKDLIAKQGLDKIKPDFIKLIEEEQFIKDIKAVKGVTVGIDVPTDQDMLVSLKLDMLTADLAALSKIEGIGFDFMALKDTTPQEYIRFLEELGAKKLSDK